MLFSICLKQGGIGGWFKNRKFRKLIGDCKSNKRIMYLLDMLFMGKVGCKIAPFRGIKQKRSWTYIKYLVPDKAIFQTNISITHSHPDISKCVICTLNFTKYYQGFITICNISMQFTFTYHQFCYFKSYIIVFSVLMWDTNSLLIYLVPSSK